MVIMLKGGESANRQFSEVELALIGDEPAYNSSVYNYTKLLDDRNAQHGIAITIGAALCEFERIINKPNADTQAKFAAAMVAAIEQLRQNSQARDQVIVGGINGRIEAEAHLNQDDKVVNPDFFSAVLQKRADIFREGLLAAFRQTLEKGGVKPEKLKGLETELKGAKLAG
ncbi:MAG: hypothetical protein V1875_05900 [Candidatus Altiarchaeota archaeon]